MIDGRWTVESGEDLTLFLTLLQADGCRWLSGHKPLEWYYVHFPVILCIRSNFISYSHVFTGYEKQVVVYFRKLKLDRIKQ